MLVIFTWFAIDDNAFVLKLNKYTFFSGVRFGPKLVSKYYGVKEINK